MDLRRRAHSGRNTGDIPPVQSRRPGWFSGAKPVQSRSPNVQEIPEPDENPRRHTVQLVSPGTRRNVQPNSGRRTADQSETAAGRLCSQSPVFPSYEPPICILTCVPTGVTKTSWSLPLSGNSSRTNRPPLRENLGTSNPEFAFTGAMTRGQVSRHATTLQLAELVFDRRRIDTVSSEFFERPFGPGNTQAIDGHHFTQVMYVHAIHQQQLLVPLGKVTPTTIIFYCRSPVRAIITPLTIT